MIYAITDRSPEYLKAIYPAPVELVNTVQEVPAGVNFIQWERGFKVYKQTREKIPIPLGRFSNVNEALFRARE